MGGWQTGVMYPLIVAILIAVGAGIRLAIKNHRESKKRQNEDQEETRARLIAAAEKIEHLECITHAEQFKEIEASVIDMRIEGTKRKQENGLIIKSLYAICDGLLQQGCNGEVSRTHQMLSDHIIDER